MTNLITILLFIVIIYLLIGMVCTAIYIIAVNRNAFKEDDLFGILLFWPLMGISLLLFIHTLWITRKIKRE
jgi:hypothetical protein